MVKDFELELADGNKWVDKEEFKYNALKAIEKLTLVEKYKREELTVSDVARFLTGEDTKNNGVPQEGLDIIKSVLNN